MTCHRFDLSEPAPPLLLDMRLQGDCSVTMVRLANVITVEEKRKLFTREIRVRMRYGTS